jgi:hypothetical protein
MKRWKWPLILAVSGVASAYSGILWEKFYGGFEPEIAFALLVLLGASLIFIAMALAITKLIRKTQQRS